MFVKDLRLVCVVFTWVKLGFWIHERENNISEDI